MTAPTKRILCFFLILLLLGLVSAVARESILPVRGPESYALFGGVAELRDDVYSADLNVAGSSPLAIALAFMAIFLIGF